MKVSIITITRNNAQGLARTLGSLRAQKDADIEHIVVDGFSTDRTAEVLKNCNAKVIKATPKGVYNAINTGIHAATGDIIGLVHAGDRLADELTLHDIVQTFKCQGCDYLYGNIYYTKNGRTTRRYNGGEASIDQLTRGNMPPHPSLYMTRECAQTIGDYVEKYKICGDFDMFVRLFSNKNLKAYYLDRDIVNMSTGGMSSALFNRLFTNPHERLAVLRSHGLPANPLRMIPRYIKIILSRL